MEKGWFFQQMMLKELDTHIQKTEPWRLAIVAQWVKNLTLSL